MPSVFQEVRRTCASAFFARAANLGIHPVNEQIESEAAASSPTLTKPRGRCWLPHSGVTWKSSTSFKATQATPTYGLLLHTPALWYGYLSGYLKWPKTEVRKPSATGILKIGAILMPLIGGDLASTCGRTRFLAEREGFESASKRSYNNIAGNGRQLQRY
jgi:hypothetical protein